MPEYTKLLIHFNGPDGSQADIVAMSGQTVSLEGTAQLDTDQKKWISSLLLDGDSDYATVPDSDDWNFGNGDYEIDFWVRFNSLAAHQVMFAMGNGTNASAFQLHTTLGLRYSVYNGNWNLLLLLEQGDVTGWAVDTWYHIAVVRNGNVWNIYRNGISLANDTAAITVPDYAKFTIGASRFGASVEGYTNGWIEEFRVSKGVPRWTENFTPPTAPYPWVEYLAGTIGAQSALTGNLQWLQELAGTIGAQSGATGYITSTEMLNGLIEAQSALTANLQWLQELAGTIGAQSGATGAVSKILVYNLAGLIAAQSSSAGSIIATELLAGLIEAQSTVAGKLRDLSSLSGTVDAQVTVAGNLRSVEELVGSIAGQSNVLGFLGFSYSKIPPFMHKDLIDPYGTMGAWLWLAEIVVPTQTTQRIARNTADVIYGGITFNKSNFDPPGRIPLTGDGSIPRMQLRVAQDGTGTLEDIVNATKGGVNGTVKLIRTCEKYFEMPVSELERTYDILTAGSDPVWVTFSLGIPNPLTQRIPLWSYSSKVCPLATPSLFKGPRCQYVGEETVCTGLLEDCRDNKNNAVHWGAEAGLDPNAVRV